MTDGFEFPDDLPEEDLPIEGASPEGSAFACCPYCGEEVELLVDPGGAAAQEYIEDCEVCCRPWRVHLRYEGATPIVELTAEDD